MNGSNAAPLVVLAAALYLVLAHRGDVPPLASLGQLRAADWSGPALFLLCAVSVLHILGSGAVVGLGAVLIAVVAAAWVFVACYGPHDLSSEAREAARALAGRLLARLH